MRKLLNLCFVSLIAILLTACGGDIALTPTAFEPTATSAAQAHATATPSPKPTSTPTAVSTETPTPDPTATYTKTATLEPTATATETAAPKPTATPTLTPSPTMPPNTLGDILVLQYHLIGEPEGRWQRTPDNFRADIERLHRLGYTPASIIDLTLGFPDLPAGRKPAVLTFDDSDISQFRYLEDGSIDPDSAVGALYEFHLKHPQDWPLKGTFYTLQDVDVPERVLFGQKELEDQKLQWLIEQGFEVASHTISHFDLKAGSDEEIQWQLAVSQRQLEARLPGYDVRSLSLPFGNYPANETLLAQGTWDDQPYTYANAVMVAGGSSPSPHSAKFNPYRIPRVQALQNELDYWLGYYEQNPQFYYVSAGQ